MRLRALPITDLMDRFSAYGPLVGPGPHLWWLRCILLGVDSDIVLYECEFYFIRMFSLVSFAIFFSRSFSKVFVRREFLFVFSFLSVLLHFCRSFFGSFTSLPSFVKSFFRFLALWYSW